MMRALRTLLQVVAIVGTLLVGILAVALIVSQTPWFRDWLRRYVVRESEQYLHGQLSTGGLGGNLLYGLRLRDAALDFHGDRVVAVKNIELDYSVFRLVSSGMVMDEITLAQPVVMLERNAQGWNVARLVKEQRKEADREGPARSLSLPVIQVTDGDITIRDGLGTEGVRLPRRISDLDINASFEYEPVHYTLTFDHLGFRGESPELQMGKLAGTISVRDDNLYVEKLRINTAETSVALDGVVERYLRDRVFNVTATGKLSLPEIGRIVPALAPYTLHPAVDIKAKGPAERMAMDLDVRSEAGDIDGQVTADLRGPDLGAEGEVDVEHLNLARLLQDPGQRSDITGRARIDLHLAAAPAGAPFVERLSGTYAFRGPRVVAAGYTASNVQVRGRIDGPRIELDGRAAAYGGTATARGFVVTPAAGRRALAFDLRGKADRVNLKSLPSSTGA